jgi:hypothetical protein
MKKLNAILGTLAVTGSLIAGLPAQADTSTTTTAAAAPSLVDRMIFSYYGVYSGPSITNPTEATLDEGKLEDVQYLDSTLTGGYKITDKLKLTFNHRFVLRPTVWMNDQQGGYKAKDPWITLSNPALVHAGGLNVSADIRLYIPAVSSAKMMGAIRLTQTTTFDIPKTRLTLGLYTIERANMLTDAGAGGVGTDMENFFLDLSPFANYQLTPTLAATFWADVVQATYSTVGGPKLAQGWANAPIPVYFGVGWDITPSVNLNPQFTVFPATATLETTTIGAILSAKLL